MLAEARCGRLTRGTCCQNIIILCGSTRYSGNTSPKKGQYLEDGKGHNLVWNHLRVLQQVHVQLCWQRHVVAIWPGEHAVKISSFVLGRPDIQATLPRWQLARTWPWGNWAAFPFLPTTQESRELPRSNCERCLVRIWGELFVFDCVATKISGKCWLHLPRRLFHSPKCHENILEIFAQQFPHAFSCKSLWGEFGKWDIFSFFLRDQRQSAITSPSQTAKRFLLAKIGDRQPRTIPNIPPSSSGGILVGVVCELSEPNKKAKYAPPPVLHSRCWSSILWGWCVDSRPEKSGSLLPDQHCREHVWQKCLEHFNRLSSPQTESAWQSGRSLESIFRFPLCMSACVFNSKRKMDSISACM